jgi:Rps23 Pro-64 3,4-dihydroxylase Tpa1-like proline 4-hydroxylase
MKINKLYDDVYEINDFLTNDEMSEVYKIINNSPEEKWFDEEMKKEQQIPDFWFGKNLYFKENTIFDSINQKMKNLFESYSYYPDKMHLQRYKKGDFIKHHADQWRTDIDYYIGYGFCLYYNDEYAGGELDYPELNITVKPKANSLYIHGGHIVHGSLPVLDDTIRYFSTVFIRGTNEQPTKLKGDLFI